MNRLPGHIFPVLALSAALAAVLGGCTRPTGAREEPKVPAMVLRPLPTDPAVTAQPLYRLQTWYLTQQVGQDDSLSDFWRFLDETALPPQERRDLARNGLRIAIGGDLAIERLNNALPKTKGMDVRALAPIYARQGYALEVPLGTPESDLPVLYSQSDGRLTGRDFAKATVFLRLAARAAPAASSTEVLVSERIVYGNPQPEFVRTPTGMILSQERPKFLFAELLRKVTLREGQIVVVGLEPGHTLSLGEQMFVSHDDTAKYVTTVVLAPELVTPAALPKGATVLGPQTPSPTPSPPDATAEPDK